MQTLRYYLSLLQDPTSLAAFKETFFLMLYGALAGALSMWVWYGRKVDRMQTFCRDLEHRFGEQGRRYESALREAQVTAIRRALQKFEEGVSVGKRLRDTPEEKAGKGLHIPRWLH